MKNKPHYSFVEKYWVKSFGLLPKFWSFAIVDDLLTDSAATSSDKGKYPLYSLTIENGVTPKTDRYEREFLLKDAENNEYKIVENRQFVFNPMNLRFGAIAIAKLAKPVLVSGYYNVLSLNKNAASGDYLISLLKSPFFNYLYETVATGSLNEKKRVHWSDFRKLQIPLPPLEEQEKIAKILSTWDEAIEKYENLIKKGLMKRSHYISIALRPNQKGWVSSRVSDLGEISKGKGISKAEMTDYGLPCIRYGEIYTVHHTVIRNFHSFIPLDIVASTKLLSKGDIVFAGSGETAEEIGKSVAYLGDDKAYVGGDTIILSPSGHSSLFLSYLFNSPHIRKQLNVLGQGNSVVHLYPKGLAEVSVSTPSLEIQNKIATYLNSLDEAILIYRQIIQSLKNQKQGLMQQLLTGKKRVKV